MSETPSSPSSEEASRERKAVRMIPFIVGCALFMQMLDATVVATAIPAMAASLGTTAVQMNISITSYLLALAVFVPISGWAAERFGARRIFITAIVLFSLSSIACAVSQNLIQLVLARIAQGAAGAMMVPVGRIIMLRKTPKEDLLKAMAFLAMPALLGPILGPPVGGFLVTYASWHWIFLINVPVGILGIYLVMRFIREELPTTSPRMDWPGFILSAVCLAALVSGFEAIGHQGISTTQVLLLLATGLVCGVLYIQHARRCDQPILDLSLLRIPSFAVSILGGLITFTGAAGALIMKVVATRIIERFGYKTVLTWNALISGLFVALCALFQNSTPLWVMVAILATGGIFRSLQFTVVNTLTYAELNASQMSKASTLAAMAQQLGISLGVGCAALVLNLSMNWREAATLERVDVMWGFIVIGLITATSFFSFRRLPENATEALEGKRRQRQT